MGKAQNLSQLVRPVAYDSATNITTIRSGASDTTAITVNASQNVTFAGNVSGVIKSGTAVASTSGTSITFTGIPTTAKRVTVMFQGVSTSGSSHILVQIGSGSITTSGYLSYSAQTGGSGSTGNGTSSTAGFIIYVFNASDTKHGAMTLANINGNSWISSQSLGGIYPSGSAGYSGGGSIALGGVLDRVSITTVNGTDTFDLGTINILWE